MILEMIFIRFSSAVITG